MRTKLGTVVLAGVLAGCGVDTNDGVAPIMEATGESSLEVGEEPELPADTAGQCPTEGPPPVDIDYWELVHIGNAVTVWKGWDCSPLVDNHCFLPSLVATVQHVNFGAGAKMRVISEMATGQPVGTNATEFTKRPAKGPAGWYTWTRDHVTTPPREQLFSVTNGSYFMCNHNEATCHLSPFYSAMSFPQKKWNTITSLGADTGTYEIAKNTSAKRVFGLSNPGYPGPQVPSIVPYNDAGLSNAATVTTALAPFFDATVGLHPVYGCETSVEYRTFIGTRNSAGRWNGVQDRGYLLTSAKPMTIVQARDILVDEFKAMYTMQLDSGGSTQFYACEGGCLGSEVYEDSFDTIDWWWAALTQGLITSRPIPEVLAVYDAPYPAVDAAER